MEGGTDTIISSASHTLREYFENLTLSGTAAINGTGNSADNVITGNSAANVLDGNTGTDTLVAAWRRYLLLSMAMGKPSRSSAATALTRSSSVAPPLRLRTMSMSRILPADKEEEVRDITGNNLGNKIYGNSAPTGLTAAVANEEGVLTGNRSDYRSRGG